LIKKLENLAKKHGETESKVLREVLDSYLKDMETKGLLFEPYRKTSPLLGMKVLARTITIEQDRRLREIAEKSGRKISELARESVDRYFL